MTTVRHDDRKAYRAAYYREHIVHIKEITGTPEARARKAIGRKANAEKYRLRHNERNRVWRQKNKGHVAAKTREYQARKLMAIPNWADLVAISVIYKAARDLGFKLGARFHVDHIVPLANDLVCGLHCEANLQILLDVENVKKSNKHWPDHPSG